MHIVKQSAKSKKRTIYLMDLEEPFDSLQIIHKALSICSSVFRGLPIGFEHFDDPATTEKFIFHSIFYTTLNDNQILDAVLFQPNANEWIEWKKLKETERQSDSAWAQWTKSQRYINVSQLQQKFKTRFHLCFGKSTKSYSKSTHFFKSDQTKDEIDKIFGFPQNKKIVTKKNSPYLTLCTKLIREKPKTELEYKKIISGGGSLSADRCSVLETKDEEIVYNVPNEESAARLIYKRGLDYYLSRTKDESELANNNNTDHKLTSTTTTTKKVEPEIKNIMDNIERKLHELGNIQVQDPREIPYDKWNQNVLDKWFARPYRNELNDPVVEDVISYRKQGIDHDFGFLIQWKRTIVDQMKKSEQQPLLIRTWHNYSVIKNVTGFQEVLRKAGFELQSEIDRLMFVECHNTDGGFTDDDEDENCLIKNKIKNSKISPWKEYPLKSSEQLLFDDLKKMKKTELPIVRKKYVTVEQFEKEETRFKQEDDNRIRGLHAEQVTSKQTITSNEFSILERVKRLAKLTSK